MKLPPGPKRTKLLMELKEKEEDLKADMAKVRSAEESAANQKKQEDAVNADAQDTDDGKMGKAFAALQNAEAKAMSGKADMAKVTCH